MSVMEPETDFEIGFRCIVQTFLRYAKQQGSEETLDKKEMSDLIKTEFKGYLMHSEVSVDDVFQEFDEDNSDSVDFTEFLKLVAKLASQAKIVEKLAALPTKK